MHRAMVKTMAVLALLVLVLGTGCRQSTQLPRRVTLQLNWLHDPTFAAHYLMAASQQGAERQVSIIEGGANIDPLTQVLNGRADVAIVGADIFLRYLDNQLGRNGNKESDLVCIFVEFQRNPVGWVLYLTDQRDISTLSKMDQKQLNKWVADQIRRGKIVVGDKRGTETTAIWMRWAKIYGLDRITVRPVGFDPMIAINSRNMLFPVYLNEEPYKLKEKLREKGGELVEIDPYIDGVQLYGNVIVTRRETLKSNPELVKWYVSKLRESWKVIKADKEAFKKAVDEVAKYYTNVERSTLENQVRRTMSFVFADGIEEPGAMSEEKWKETLESLKVVGIVKNLTIEQVMQSVVPLLESDRK